MHDSSNFVGTLPAVIKKGYGKRIRAARERQGWTQAELAERLRTSPSTVSNLEREQHPPTVPDEVNDLVVALGLSAEDLLRDMGVNLTPPAAARLPRPLIERLVAASGEEIQGLLLLFGLAGGDSQAGAKRP